MILGHTEPEFAQFTKTERRILRMAALEMKREEILAALEITDSTLRVHLANIRRKQAEMRKKRAEAATARANERMIAKFIPEQLPERQEEPASSPVRTLSLHRAPPLEPPPLARPVALPPPARTLDDIFVPVPGATKTMPIE